MSNEWEIIWHMLHTVKTAAQLKINERIRVEFMFSSRSLSFALSLFLYHHHFIASCLENIPKRIVNAFNLLFNLFSYKVINKHSQFTGNVQHKIHKMTPKIEFSLKKIVFGCARKNFPIVFYFIFNTKLLSPQRSECCKAERLT